MHMHQNRFAADMTWQKPVICYQVDIFPRLCLEWTERINAAVFWVCNYMVQLWAKNNNIEPSSLPFHHRCPPFWTWWARPSCPPSDLAFSLPANHKNEKLNKQLKYTHTFLNIKKIRTGVPGPSLYPNRLIMNVTFASMSHPGFAGF